LDNRIFLALVEGNLNLPGALIFTYDNYLTDLYMYSWKLRMNSVCGRMQSAVDQCHVISEQGETVDLAIDSFDWLIVIRWISTRHRHVYRPNLASNPWAVSRVRQAASTFSRHDDSGTLMLTRRFPITI